LIYHGEFVFNGLHLQHRLATEIEKLGADAEQPHFTSKLEYDKEIKELMREQAVRCSVPKLQL
jgi:hypothetical protein